MASIPTNTPTLHSIPACLSRGKRLSRDLVGIRRSLGVCFQQNTLFDQLTVLQHLELFSVVKGVRAKDIKDEAARMVRGACLPRAFCS